MAVPALRTPPAIATTDALQILTTWFSPAFPVGSFSYSHGLERAVADGAVADGPALQAWVADLLRHGAGRSDAMLLAAAFRAEDPRPVADLALALAPSAERLLETRAQGAGFVRTAGPVWGLDIGPLPYPVAVGHAARRLGLPLDLAALLFVQAFAAAVISAGVRLIPLGQTAGQAITAALLPLAAEAAAEAVAAPLSEIGGLCFAADLASMAHETLETRLYRS